MTTVPYVMESKTLSTLQTMADDGDFVAESGDNIVKLKSDHVLIRDTPDDRPADTPHGERNIPRPALIITYLGTTMPVGAGQNCQDDGKHRILIQLIDDVPPINTNRRKTYHKWMSLIRLELQANPYRAELAATVADIYLIHINQISRADERSYTLHQQMRAGLELTAYAREFRE